MSLRWAHMSKSTLSDGTVYMREYRIKHFIIYKVMKYRELLMK